jgi:hypothetical protein
MKNRIFILFLTVVILSGCSTNETMKYVCDYSEYYSDFEKSLIEVELTYKEEILLYETNIQKFYFFTSASEYSKEFLTRSFMEFDDGCYKVEVEILDDRAEIKTIIDYENLSADYKALYENADGKVLIGESIEYLESNNCVKQ